MQAGSLRSRGTKTGSRCVAKFFPALRAREIGAGGRFRDQNDARSQIPGIPRLRDRAPQVVFDDEEFRLRVREKLQMLGGREFVIERNQDAAAEENRVGGNQPFRLIGHDDRGARAVREIRRPAARARGAARLP